VLATALEVPHNCFPFSFGSSRAPHATPTRPNRTTTKENRTSNQPTVAPTGRVYTRSDCTGATHRVCEFAPHLYPTYTAPEASQHWLWNGWCLAGANTTRRTKRIRNFRCACGASTRPLFFRLCFAGSLRHQLGAFDRRLRLNLEHVTRSLIEACSSSRPHRGESGRPRAPTLRGTCASMHYRP